MEELFPKLLFFTQNPYLYAVSRWHNFGHI